MNKVILKQGEEIYLDDSNIQYILYTNTPIYISDKVYFTDDDNFFHFCKAEEKITTIVEDINTLINDIKNLFGFCNVENINQINIKKINIDEINNTESKNDDKLYFIIQKGTIIKMNNLPITLGIDMNFYIKPKTNFIIPEYSDIEIVSRNNIIKIINKEQIECKYSKIL